MNILSIRSAAGAAPLVTALVLAASLAASTVFAAGNGQGKDANATCCCTRSTMPAAASSPGGKGDYLVTVGKRTIWASQAAKAASSCCSNGNCCSAGGCCTPHATAP